MKNYVPELIFALVLTNVILVIIGLQGHPPSNWTEVVVVAYGCSIVARLMIVFITTRLLLDKLSERASKLSRQMGLDPGQAAERPSRGAVLLALIFVLAMGASVYGLTLAATGQVVPLLGLPEIGMAFHWIAWVLLAVGLIIQATMMLALAAIFWMADQRLQHHLQVPAAREEVHAKSVALGLSPVFAGANSLPIQRIP